MCPESPAVIDRDPEADDPLTLTLTLGGHLFRLLGPRRYGKTTLLGVYSRQLSARAWRPSWSTCRRCCQSPRSWSGSSVPTTGSKARYESACRRCLEPGTSACHWAAVLLRLLELPRELDPLPATQTTEYIERRFARARRDPGSALRPLLEFARGRPQRSMMLAHYL